MANVQLDQGCSVHAVELCMICPWVKCVAELCACASVSLGMVPEALANGTVTHKFRAPALPLTHPPVMTHVRELYYSPA
jgi:hypothetical protein